MQIILLLLTAIFIYILFSFSLLLFSYTKKCKDETKTVYIYHDIAHTEIIIPINYFHANYQSQFPNLLKNSPNGYIAFSYGDREFMMNTPSWSDINYITALKALFLNTPGLIRVGHYWNIDKKLCIEVKLSQYCLINLNKSILNSFKKNRNHFIRYLDSYKQKNIFYFQAKKSYNLFHTCNSWTGERLKEAGLEVPYFTPFAYEVIHPLN